ncbi:protein CASPARIAN STRIP INTEGRITY FACTOR 1-like [Triticum dicoccoides]|nr:protein CASPARIAN STRIP INTEGRITY FACTOR 1-like [Triticum dicoccoides]
MIPLELAQRQWKKRPLLHLHHERLTLVHAFHALLLREGERMHRVSNPEMGMPRRSASLFALAFFALLLSTSLAGRQRPSFIVDQEESLGQQGEAQDEAAMAQPVHSRMLKDVTTSDYGTYDPTPSMQKPHFKLIPN